MFISLNIYCFFLCVWSPNVYWALWQRVGSPCHQGVSILFHVESLTPTGHNCVGPINHPEHDLYECRMRFMVEQNTKNELRVKTNKESSFKLLTSGLHP